MLSLVVAALLIAALVVASYRRLLGVCRAENDVRPLLRQRGGRSATSSQASVAEMNERTIDLKHALDHVGLVPKHCGRACLAVGVLFCIIEIWPRESGADFVAPSVILLLGVGGAMGCVAIGRMAERRAEALREQWNTLIRRLAQDVPT